MLMYCSGFIVSKYTGFLRVLLEKTRNLIRVSNFNMHTTLAVAFVEFKNAQTAL